MFLFYSTPRIAFSRPVPANKVNELLKLDKINIFIQMLYATSQTDMTKLIILWASTIFLISFACLPYKSRKNPDQISTNELLVTNQQCTDCGAFLVLKGQLEIPEDLRKYWTINPFEFNTTGDNTPFEVVDESQYNFDLITDNSFVLTGKVIGVDSTSFETNIVPIYQIDSWFPTKYHPILWTFSSGTLLIYIVTCLILFIASIIYSLKLVRRGNQASSNGKTIEKGSL